LRFEILLVIGYWDLGFCKIFLNFAYFIDQLKDKIKKLELNIKIIRLKPYKAHIYKISIIKNLARTK